MQLTKQNMARSLAKCWNNKKPKLDKWVKACLTETTACAGRVQSTSSIHIFTKTMPTAARLQVPDAPHPTPPASSFGMNKHFTWNLLIWREQAFSTPITRCPGYWSLASMRMQHKTPPAITLRSRLVVLLVYDHICEIPALKQNFALNFVSKTTFLLASGLTKIHSKQFAGVRRYPTASPLSQRGILE